MKQSFTIRGAVMQAGFGPLLVTLAAAAEPAAIDFNRDIRPILSENCFYCHGQDAGKRQAELRLDLREEAMTAGAIVPHDTAGSLILERVHSQDPDLVMPPPGSNRRLTADQKNLLSRWISEGAAYQPHWAFVAPTRPEPPPIVEGTPHSNWPRNPIDRFILERLVEHGIAPSPEGDRATLIRRLHADLVGLPPSPAEVDAFVSDPSPDAYERLVDRLLASPHSGERMAIDWLDAARYADSNGFQQDGDTWQWIWRDWVVKALNDDMPFDRFSTEQLAGDLLPNATVEQRVATGFNRNHLLNGEGGAIAEEQRFNNLFDRVDTTSTTWLGLTMACAQCHDHKYDPLTMVDYYSLLDAFNRVPESGAPTRFSARIRVAPPVVDMPTAENTAHLGELEKRMKDLEAAAKPVIDAAYASWKTGLFADGEPADGRDLPRNLTPLLRKPGGERTEDDKKSIESQLRRFFDDTVKGGIVKELPQVVAYEASRQAYEEYKGDRIPRVMVMSDERPRETRVLDRGDYLSPMGERLTFTTPAFLPRPLEGACADRLGLARWLFLPEHPLTARVQVNRMWQRFFGTGLVKTAEDLGVQSEYPLHRELLDWLAVEFRESGWSQKHMHRLILGSATYRQASRVTSAQLAIDPENRLLGRSTRFRMPSMVLRDWALASAGLLDRRIGGQPVYPYQPDAIWEALAITKERDFTYPSSHGADLYRRSLYTFWRRTVAPANMFDAANRQTCTVRAGRTSTPLHALTTLNDPTWVEAARVLAERCMREAVEQDRRLSFAFRLVVGRHAADDDIAALSRLFENQLTIYRTDPEAARGLLSVGEWKRDESLDPVEHAALTIVCLAILNLDESLTRE
ncbi:MAG: PSD1 and planctomycete cytochrome C domain-containing protein [Planctomycetaceae bacterium]